MVENFILSLQHFTFLELFINSYALIPLNKMGLWRGNVGTLLKKVSLSLLKPTSPFNTRMQLSLLLFTSFRLPIFILNNKNPLEVLFKVQPNHSKFKVFCCQCVPYIWPNNGHKLEYKPPPWTFLGYTLSHKGNKCLNSNGQVYISRHVTFNEFVFLFKAFPFHLLLHLPIYN